MNKGEHGVGPSLHGILGQPAGKQDGFLFSAALEALGIVWDAETLSAFLENPMSYVPGSVMPFAGINKTEERAALVCWLAAQPADK
jgi:cytochrome c